MSFSSSKPSAVPRKTSTDDRQTKALAARRRTELKAIRRELGTLKSGLESNGKIHETVRSRLFVDTAYPIYLLPQISDKVAPQPIAPPELWDDLPGWIGPGSRGYFQVPSLADDPLFHDNGKPCLLPFLPKGSWGNGAALLVPGGNYEFLTPHEAAPIATWLSYNLSIPVFVLRHRLLPTYGLDDMGADFCAAMVRIRGYVNGGPVVAFGFSSGAHLSACVSASAVGSGEEGQDIWPNAQVFLYPSIDPNDWLSQDSSGFWRVDVSSPQVKSLVKGRSRLFPGSAFVAPPPTFMVASIRDDICPPRNHTDPYARGMQKAGVACEYLKGNYGGHGFSHMDFWKEPCLKWLRGQGFGFAE